MSEQPEEIAKRIVKRHWGWRDAKLEADIVAAILTEREASATAIKEAEARAYERAATRTEEMIAQLKRARARHPPDPVGPDYAINTLRSAAAEIRRLSNAANRENGK